MDVTIRLPQEGDLPAYTDLLQQTYADAYTNDGLGLTKEVFSQKIFNAPNTQKYLASNLVINENQKTWLAFIDDEMVGSITISDKGNECELRGFYVKTKYQGEGIGRKLWKLALEFSGQKDIVLDSYTHNTKTIEMYKKWGFVIDTAKGEFYRHWLEWPDGLQAKCLYMRLKRG